MPVCGGNDEGTAREAACRLTGACAEVNEIALMPPDSVKRLSRQANKCTMLVHQFAFPELPSTKTVPSLRQPLTKQIIRSGGRPPVERVRVQPVDQRGRVGRINVRRLCHLRPLRLPLDGSGMGEFSVARRGSHGHEIDSVDPAGHRRRRNRGKACCYSAGACSDAHRGSAAQSRRRGSAMRYAPPETRHAQTDWRLEIRRKQRNLNGVESAS